MSDTELSPVERSDGDPLAQLRDELAELTTETLDPARSDLDLWPTDALVRAMNAEDALVPGAVAAAAASIASAVDAITERMRRGGRLIYVGAGTSGRLGVLDASECPPTFGIEADRVVGVIAGGDTALRKSVESAEDGEAHGAADIDGLHVGPDDAVVGIAASGRTPFVLGALRRSAELGALTVALACNSGSKIGEITDIAIEVVVGPEFIAGSTRLKSGTAEKLVLNMISTLTMVRLGKTYGNVMIDLRATNEKLRARAQRTVMVVTGRELSEVDRALDAAGGSAKVAALMLLSDLSAEAAASRLKKHTGSLRSALTGTADGR